MQTIETGRLPIMLWSDEKLEGEVRTQAMNLAHHPYTRDRIVLSADFHKGYGMPIGGVCATKGVIIPEAVGVDISCGVHAARTSLQNISYNDLLRIVDEIKSKIPVGFNHRSESLWAEMPSIDVDKKNMPVVNAEYDSACHQLGTLGGGK